jgi:hypothetical protein
MSDKTQNPIYIPKDFVDSAKELQYVIEFEEDDNRQLELAAEAIDILGDPREYFGAKKVYIRAMGAYVLYDGISNDALYYHNLVLNEVTLKSDFSKLAFARKDNLRSLCMYLFDSEVLSNKDKTFDGAKIRTGVYVPVLEIESVWPAV